jgi:hypothetical protein
MEVDKSNIALSLLASSGGKPQKQPEMRLQR